MSDPDPNNNAVKRQRSFRFRNCAYKFIVGCTGAYFAGGLFGFVSSSMNRDTIRTLVRSDEHPEASRRSVLRAQIRIMQQSAKGTAMMVAIFTGVDCALETLRGKNDWRNHTAAGAVTGGIIGLTAGLRYGLIGAVTFAAIVCVLSTEL